MIEDGKVTAEQAGRLSVDLDHNLEKILRITRDKVGELLSCHICHGFLLHTGRRRPLLSFEALLSQGTSVVPEVTKDSEAWPALALLTKQDISQADLMSITGNSWHIPTVGTFLLYVLASVRHTDWTLKRSVGSYVYDIDGHEEII